MRLSKGVLLIFTVGLFLAAASPGSATVRMVNIGNFFFSPDTITASVGDTVRWTHIGTVAHTTTSNSLVWDSGTMNNGDTFDFQFNAPGEFPYHCTFHSAVMKGVVNVVTGIPCDDITSLVARCIGAGTKSIQARVRATGDWTGTTVTISIDGTPHVVGAQVKSDGSASQWKLQVAGVGTGTHTVSLDDPAGCEPDKIVDCGTDQPVDEEWNDDASWGTSDLDATVVPIATKLIGAYPNPFNPATTLIYELSVSGQVTLVVSDIVGREVARLVDGYQEAGYKTVTFDATNLSTGIYFYRLQAGSFVETKKLILMR